MRSDENYWRDKNWYYHNDIDRLINFLIPDGSKKKEFSDTSLTQLATPTSELFEYIVLNNVISSLGDIQETLTNLRKNINETGRLVLIFHNYLWEPIFNVLEFLGLKHKPVRQNWLSFPDVENFLLLSGYEVVKSGRRMLFPAYIPILSDIINSIIAELPLISRLCVTQFVVARPISRRLEITVSP